MNTEARAQSYNPLDDAIALDPPLHTHGIGWEEHIPFAMALVNILRPAKIVELGVHSGDSYLAFCQAVHKLGLQTTCWGVDTWRGDAHAGFYGEPILQALKLKHAPYEKFSTLKQMTFDEALQEVEDDSIDLLHIDGFHTYEAVSHDFDTWLPKARQVILFHDIRETGRGFGVWKLWAEIETAYPGRTFAFDHGHGLGVLFAGSMTGRAKLFHEATQGQADVVRRYFAALGGAVGLRLHASRLQAAISAQQSAPAASTHKGQLLRELSALKAHLGAMETMLQLP